jgi:cell division protein FtsI/penicillin-binding protein 2
MEKLLLEEIHLWLHLKKKSIVKSNEFNSVSTSINKLLFYANETSEELYKNFLVAGKTGTADISNKSSQNVTYISYFPYNNPKYLSLTFMSNPKNKYGPYMTAGNTVKPVFFNILKEIYVNLDLSILDIKGTDI